ncbi:hypothetical protein [Macrococcus equipercicus]|uniref:GNAT family N-acetyltransferase n=1 Tax=Macrococcus equipercicus TaxID=69967 RepID=A0A9Q9BRB1_9STAP|nr:hypothetical protein [Macrococcus equipercicus]UTH14149.1 GNAT family N-acetyltransferase [Macrococcus equipercicus]
MIKELTNVELPDYVEDIAALHLANFDDKRSMRQLCEDMKKYSETQGFRCLVSTNSGIVTGFLFGYMSAADQFYRGLIDQFITADEQQVLNSSFEVVSMAVKQGYRQNGTGSALLAALTAEPGRYYLTADVHDVRANAFYYKNDWKLVKSNLKLHPNIAPKNLYYKQADVHIN